MKTPFVELKMIVNRGKVRLDTVQQRNIFIFCWTLSGREFLKIFCWTLSGRVLYFAGHCLAENFLNILLDIVRQRIFFLYFAGHCPAEKFFFSYFAGYCLAEKVCWTLSGREFCIEKDGGGWDSRLHGRNTTIFIFMYYS